MNETIRETADSLLAKQAKIDVAERAAYIDDLTQMQDAQRESVRRYQELKVFGNRTPAAEPPEQGDSDVPRIVVCDDYHVDNATRQDAAPQQTSKGMIAAAMITAVALAGYTGYTFAPKGETTEPNIPAVTADDQNTRYSLEFSDQ
jgi:hypothetical protein